MKNLSYQQRKNIRGYGFISVWIIGVIIWFIIPAINSLEYSFRNVNPNNENMLGEWKGIDNYIYAFSSDAYYTQRLWESLKETVIMTPITVIFALFIALLLNRKFKFRNFAVSVFFLPVIIASGAVYNIISGDISKTSTDNSIQFSSMLSGNISESLSEITGFYGADTIIETAEMISSEIINLVWYSGIQIVIFMAVLQTIPQSAKEIAIVEGATEWEFFWKITLPYISPAITANTIITAINTFTVQNNQVIRRILDMQSEWYYGRASAMAWSYFIIILIFTGILILIFRNIFRWE